jgi:hypothetical protein
VTDGLRGWVLRFFHVPPEPRLPAGEPGTARVFRASRNYWRLRLIQWSAKQAATVAGFMFFMGMLQFAPESINLKNKGQRRQIPTAPFLVYARNLEALAVGLWILQLPITFALARLDYELRWYIVTDRSARLREGILTLSEMTFTLANVQDIRIRQGPLQRLLGLADVELRTAGGSEPTPGGGGHGGSSRNLHVAQFRGVDNADAIRDLVVDRMRRARGAGLGDPEDHRATPGPATVSVPLDLERAAREMADEAARLRRAVDGLAGRV